MYIVIAPDSFKGSLSSAQAADAIESGVKKTFPLARIGKVLIADGGEGTVEAIVKMAHGQIMHTMVEGPLGESVNAAWGIIHEGNVITAVIEMAEASGLLITPKEKRNVRLASTYGTGQLIKAAMDKGAKRIIIGIGGSATNDGGAGMASALGARFLDKNGRCLVRGGAALAQLAHIDVTKLDARLTATEVYIASDVNNPLCGVRGASAVYGPQKGATPEIVQELDTALLNYANVAKQDLKIDVGNIPGSGAAGGLGAGLLLFTNGKAVPGIELILHTIHFAELIKGAAFIITGEGYTDAQTAQGKAPVGVAAVAKKQNIPVVCLSGALTVEAKEVLSHGIDAIAALPYAPATLAECMQNAAVYLTFAAERTCQLIKVGMSLPAEK